MLEHGGNLVAASQQYNIPLSEWLDLSTGINPHAWPVPEVSAASWQHLPAEQDALTDATFAYYGSYWCLPVAGSQAAIQVIPQLREPCRVGVIAPGYAEHAQAWQRAGHEVIPIAAQDIDAQVDALDVLVVINPNNPTGHRFSKEQLLTWHRRLQSRRGWLLVDEAFMDVTPEHSIARDTHQAGLIVLRSVGKFFGLAGARCGFVLAEKTILQQLRELLGPWSLSGPTREVVNRALRDRAWQQKMRERLIEDQSRLSALLTRHHLAPTGGTALFQWLQHREARHIHTALCEQGILTRYFEHTTSVRFGLPGTDPDWQRLETALRSLRFIHPQRKPADKNQNATVV